VEEGGLGLDALIRKCVEEDLAEVMKLEEESFKFPYDMETFTHFLSSDRAIFLVYDLDGAVEGYIICDIRGEDVGVVVSIAVSPKHRRMGLGSALLDAAMSKMRGKVSKLVLQVAKSDEGAIRFYRIHGFTTEGTLPHYYPDGEGAYLMTRTL
jgi:ribosomal-protein-alanine N-acetyltransferase